VAAQSTLAAGQAEAQNLNNQSTAVALNLTQAAATEASFVRQTQWADQATSTARAIQATEQQAAINATATVIQQAYLYAVTQTVAIEQTQSVQATQTVHAIQTATAWPQTATPQEATQIAIVAAAIATERRSYWSQYVIPFWVFIGAVVLILILLAAGYTFKRLLPALELRARTIISPDGEVITFLPAHNEIKAILPGRAVGPALHSERGQSQVSGLAPDMNLQDRTLARHQATRMTSILPPGRSQRHAQRILNTNLYPTGENTAAFHILQRGERPPMMDAETLEILEGQWREIHD